MPKSALEVEFADFDDPEGPLVLNDDGLPQISNLMEFMGADLEVETDMVAMVLAGKLPVEKNMIGRLLKRGDEGDEGDEDDDS